MTERKTMDPRKVFGNAVLSMARENPNIVALSADSGSGSNFEDFKAEFPNRFFECGIMEQCVVGITSGLAAAGKIPVFCAIAPFVTSRPFEMLRNDLGYMRQNVKIVGRNSGITYSDLGPTHYTLEDLAIMRMIPGFTVLAPQDPGEIRMAVRAMFEHEGPVYMRIGSAPIPELYDERPFTIGKGRVVQEGSDVTIVVTGEMAGRAISVAKSLAEQGISARVSAMPTVWPADRDLIEDSARKTGRLVTLEEHYVVGGLGTIVQEICAETYPVPVKKIGLPHEYTTSGPYSELCAYYGLDVESITKTVAGFVQSKV